MARPLNIKEVKARIKTNKALMVTAKKDVNEAMTHATKGGDIVDADVRKSLAIFIKANNAVKADLAKLEKVGE